MTIIKGNIKELKPLHEPVALTFGNFDGVHKGHIHLFRILKEKAQNKNLKTAVLTFDPHPNSLFEKSGFKPLQTETGKIKHLENQGMDYIVIQNFDRTFSHVSKEDFLKEYLTIFFKLRFLLFGYNLFFGRKGEGDFDFTRHFLKNRNIEAHQTTALNEDNEIISSSKIRYLLLKGEIEKANRKLGYSFSVEGKVVKGKSFGKTLGFPTANLEEIFCLTPSQGVYAGWVKLSNKKRPAVMNIGKNPSVREDGIFSLECHIPGFHGNLYDKKLCFNFEKKLRDEKKFSNLDELKNQIRKDVDEAKKIFNQFQSTLHSILS